MAFEPKGAVRRVICHQYVVRLAIHTTVMCYVRSGGAYPNSPNFFYQRKKKKQKNATGALQ
ncbi:hypothetical protein HPP92_008320 [Vanilla planifolia]|uniref:Uncharacterized protein n=1 Tax=Vanilla planifolia TaxID=51239 RepID=A0A835V5W7_VANPL|nr:hypothetical protein HPP92_008320 [Vanilla planifolia]